MEDRKFSYDSQVPSLHVRSAIAPAAHRWARTIALTLIMVAMACSVPAALQGQDANFIWSPQIDIQQNDQSQGEVFYRKRFTLVKPIEAQLQLVAGDEFEFYINDQLVARGQSYGSKTEVDVTDYLLPGVNLVAAKVRHFEGAQPGLAVRLRVKEKGEIRYRSLVSDDSWKTHVQEIEDWGKTRFKDLSWLPATKLNISSHLALDSKKKTPSTTQQQPAKQVAQTPVVMPGETIQDSAPPVPKDSAAPKTPATQASAVVTPLAKNQGRFTIDPEFRVEEVLSDKETGSLIAMEFDEFGRVLLSKEGGPLMIADPSLPQGTPNRVRVYCEEVNTCQGILPLNGDVYVTAEGPHGQGLYKLTDKNKSGQLKVVSTLLKFTGQPSEHGAHSVKLGPDGMIYVLIGNGSKLRQTIADSSPYKHEYEGDLVPRYEDPGGQSIGAKAPGGTIVRVTIDGSKVERVAGGLRNAYDMVFDSSGNLFVHDSDMESDMGTTWYRPTMVFNVPAGGDFGWRSGWAKFPQHFIDQVPATCETGRGSPTGAVLYEHLQFPVRYQDTIFLADWAQGSILALRTQEEGATFAGEVETFLKGRPLNVCDLAVGEDGSLYFCTGGRGTAGGVYRVVWNGKVPASMLNYESELAKVIRHPQPDSAWARQNIAQLRRSMGDSWGPSLIGVAKEARNSVKHRMRALNYMVLYGPRPTKELLGSLAGDAEPNVRSGVAELCGTMSTDYSSTLLNDLLADGNAMVRRKVCESMLRRGIEPQYEQLVPMLRSQDRIEALVARRLLERIPTDQWFGKAITTDDKRVFIQGALAACIAQPSLARSYDVLSRSSEFMEGFVSDADFIDLLRVIELAMVRGEVDPEKIPAFSSRIANEFPSGNPVINQELVRVLAYLGNGQLEGRLEEYLESLEVSDVDKYHAAMFLQTIGTKLDGDSRLAIIDTLERLKAENDTAGYAAYAERAIREVASTITSDQIREVLKNGKRWPNAMLPTLYLLPDQLDQEMVDDIVEIDQSLVGKESDAARKLRMGIIAVLARSGDDASMSYLRESWEKEVDRRNDLAIGLAQLPDGENWAYLVSSLPVVDDTVGGEVLTKLASVQRRPRDAKFYREVINLGYRMRQTGIGQTVQLLEHWSGEQINAESESWEQSLSQWKDWYDSKFPNGEPISTEAPASPRQYTTEKILTDLETNGAGDAQRGRALFTSTNCANCHRFGANGKAIGPDLTTLTSRFSLREIIEATVDPSKVVADRYRSKTILTESGKQFTGLAAKDHDGSWVVLLEDGKRVRIEEQNIEDIKENQTSSMPEGLLDGLSEQQIADLFAFLTGGVEQLAEKPSAESVK
jgi:putative heme-binding domain-containing protein